MSGARVARSACPGVLPKLMLITDATSTDDAIVRNVEACVAALPPHALAVQLRDKIRDAKDPSLRALALRLRGVTRPPGDGTQGDGTRGARLLVNGHIELARDIDADGVHLGGGAVRPDDARLILGDGAIISVAAHDDETVAVAIARGASAALVSPIYATPGKGPPRGTVALARARALAPPGFTIYALGGIDEGNAAECIAAGAHGVAVVRALRLSPERVPAAARAMYTRITS